MFAKYVELQQSSFVRHVEQCFIAQENAKRKPGKTTNRNVNQLLFKIIMSTEGKFC